MAVEGKNFRSITPQEILVKIIGRMTDEVLAKGYDPKQVRPVVEYFTDHAMSLSNEEAEAILQQHGE